MNARQLIEQEVPDVETAVQTLTDHAKADPRIQDFRLTANGRWIELAKIVVKLEARNQGVGSEYIRAVKALGKQYGLPVLLSPEADRGRKTDLERFYRNQGFAPHKGRNRDYSIGGAFGGEWIHHP